MKLIYVLDPMCSWCWAFSPVIKQLKAHYPNLQLSYVMGGLAPDNNQPMSRETQQMIQTTWHQISERTGTQFNFDFWQQCQPRRSTYPACRAVISADSMNPGAGERMIGAIQHAYYLQARNPSDDTTLIELAEEIGLNGAVFAELLNSDEIRETLEQQIELARAIGAQGFPSLYLATADNLVTLCSGYTDWESLKGRVEAGIARG